MSTATIRGSVGARLLDKADRLFPNNDAGIWIEVLQNARRAGATSIEVSIQELANPQGCLISVQDDGCGIDDFQKLVALGDSEWAEETERAEDPAGMGFFSLCHSEVEVYSGCQFVRITPEVFLGKAEAKIEQSEMFVAGTRLRFRRSSTKVELIAALERVSRFLPLEVRLQGQALPRHDFLEGALVRELIDGIEVGFATEFMHADGNCYDDNWNFYGARLRHAPMDFTGLLLPGQTAPATIRARFQVLETGTVKLQLPDRKGVIEDESLRQFLRKARAVAYRFFQAQPKHGLPYVNWQEAKDMGILLPEATPLLKTWHAWPQDSGAEGMFGTCEARLLQRLDNVILAPRDLPIAHTLEAALNSCANLDADLYLAERAFKGYSWYDKLPRIVNMDVLIDGIPYENWYAKGPRPAQIQLELTIEQAGTERKLSLPALIHVGDEQYNEHEFVTVGNSPWDSDEFPAPFDIVEFLIWATFSSSDDIDADSWETQRDRYQEEVTRTVNGYFRGPKANLMAILRSAIDWEARRLSEQLGINEIRFKRVTNSWEVELITSETTPNMNSGALPQNAE